MRVLINSKCRECGCSDLDCTGCIEKTGAPCWWVESDLCSTCADPRDAGNALVRHAADSICSGARVPGAIVIVVDRTLHLHCAMSALAIPGTPPPGIEPLMELYRNLHDAVERFGGGAIGDAPPPRPPDRAACIHCKSEICAITDADAIRLHSTTCAASPVVEENKQLKAEQTELLNEIAVLRRKMAEQQEDLNRSRVRR